MLPLERPARVYKLRCLVYFNTRYWKWLKGCIVFVRNYITDIFIFDQGDELRARSLGSSMAQ